MSSTSSQEIHLLPFKMALSALEKQGGNKKYLLFSIHAVTLQLADVFVNGKGVLRTAVRVRDLLLVRCCLQILACSLYSLYRAESLLPGGCSQKLFIMFQGM